MSKAIFMKARHALARSEGTGHAIVERTLRKHGLDSRVAVRVPHFLSLPMIVGSSDLVATVPRRTAQQIAAIAAIEIMPLAIDLSVPVSMAWHRRAASEPAQLWFRSLLIEAARE